MSGNFRISSWSRVLIYKLILAQLVKNFNAFHETRRFNTVSTRARHWFTSSHIISVRSILLFSSHLCLGLSCDLFLSCFMNNFLYVPSSPPCPFLAHCKETCLKPLGPLSFCFVCDYSFWRRIADSDLKAQHEPGSAIPPILVRIWENLNW